MTDVPRDRPRGGKGGDRNAAARARAQARRDAIIKAERRRRLGFLGIGGVVGLVVVLIVVFVVINAVDKKNGGKDVNATASAQLVSDITTIPASTYQQVGTTGVGTSVLGLSTITGGTPVTTNGLPTFIYVGGEFCPYCAAERWAITAALSRFGTFSGLETTRAAATDGNYATVSFLNATYTSKYLAASLTEQEDRAHNLIKNPPDAENAAFTKYGQGSYPFVDINNQYLGRVQFDVRQLGTLTADQIAAQIKDPSTQLGKSVLASANVLTAGICQTTKQQPTAVCSSSEVQAATQFLNTQPAGSTSGS